MYRVILRIAVVCGLSSLMLLPMILEGQETKPAATEQPKEDLPPGKLIEIPNEPKTVDPATLVPARLANPVSVEFQEQTLRGIADWIQKEQKIEVLLDQKALTEDASVSTEQISESFNNYPLYLLLERLRPLGLEWYMEGGNLHITTSAVAANKLTTLPYNVGDLVDAGFKPTDLTESILTTTEGPWTGSEHAGSGIVLLGDVLFVRQTDRMHRQVAGLLAALRKHGRRTFSFDAPQNENLRQKLDSNVTVNFKETSLSWAVGTLAKQAQIDIRLDKKALIAAGVRDRSLVTLALTDQKLSTVLQTLLTDFNLTWVLRDGVLWITSNKQAGGFMKTAVYSVVDLSRDTAETIALKSAIERQTRGPWKQRGVTDAPETLGVIDFARPGVMIVRQTESGLGEVSQLLENYRTALKASKPRKAEGLDSKEVMTRYYRVPTRMADELVNVLPEMVEPETWKTKERPNGLGTLVKLASKPSLVSSNGEVVDPADGDESRSLVVQNSVLIVRQTRAVQRAIARLIRQIETGDELEVVEYEGEGGHGTGGGGMGGMGGGFGGGFFSIPGQAAPKP